MITVNGEFTSAVVYSDNISESAYEQLQRLCDHPMFGSAVIRVMPDCHAGKGCVIGFTSVSSEKIIVPNLVGVDIACGVMSTVFECEGLTDFFELDRFIRDNIPSGVNIREDPSSVIKDFEKHRDNISRICSIIRKEEMADSFTNSIGTLGGGNHFIEIGRISDNRYMLSVHTGSRSLGNHICKYFQAKGNMIDERRKKALLEKHRTAHSAEEHRIIQQEIESLPRVSPDAAYITDELFDSYIDCMLLAEEYAAENRRCITEEIMSFLSRTAGASVCECFDTVHNYVDWYDKEHRSIIVRKGAISAKAGQRLCIHFGNAFYYCVKDKDTGRIKKDKSGNPMTRRRSEKSCYDILALIGSLRQWSFHGNDRNDPTWLYHLEDLDKEFLHILDELYDETIGRVNHDFVNNNKVNILILSQIFGDEALPTLIREYYDFLVTKKYKNIGFSIKKLREIMVEDTSIKEEKYDSVRSKLYKLLDFIIWHGYLYEDAKIADELVNGLRGSLSNEDKDYIYCREANRLWKKYINIIFNYALPAVDGKNIKDLQNKKLDEIDIGKGLIKESREVSYFTKLMYLLTLFIDGKEINDLLTTLINKFDNIRSFNETMESLGLVTSLVSEYSIFEKSDVIFRELTELNSFARMCSIDITAKRVMFCDAIDILGIETDMTDDELASMIDRILCLDANGQPVKDKNKKDSGLRNFIASNVIDSTRFKYLIRYGNSKKIRALANCETAVRFVLKGIPDEQIERYYESCRDLGEKRLDSFDEKRAYLAGQIKEMSFEKIEKAGSVQKANVGGYGKDSETKRRYQAVIRLYLTVMYLMLKNLVNVNSRYVMGFHCLERDFLLYRERSGEEPVKIGKDLRRLTFKLMDIPSSALSSGVLVGDCDVDMAENAGNRHLKKKRWYGIIFDNLKHSEISVITRFRNTVAHLNAIRNIDENIQGIAYVNNYFELYHYIIQRALQKNANNPGKYTAEYLKNLDRYGTYSKDFVKAYCTPMAYNPVRYKNLTIDGQFDKNYRPEENKDKSLIACGAGS